MIELIIAFIGMLILTLMGFIGGCIFYLIGDFNFNHLKEAIFSYDPIIYIWVIMGLSQGLRIFIGGIIYFVRFKN